MRNILLMLACGGLAMLPASLCAQQPAGDFTYAGKTLEMVVPYPPGGGTTLTGQFFARWLERHLDGQPKIQVVNIEGASGVIGSNEYAQKYPHDGNTLLTGAFSSTTPYLFKEEGVMYDLREFEALAAIPAGNVVYARTDAGITSAADLKGRTEPLYNAAARPSGGDLIRVFSFELLGIPVVTNYGYDGRGAARLAFEQGEATIDVQTAPAYISNVQPLVEEGIAAPVYTLGVIRDGEVARDPAFPDLPHTGEVYEMLHGKKPEGPQWEAYKFLVAAGISGSKILWVHGDAPDAALQKLRAAVEAMAKDPQLAVEGQDELGGYEMLHGSELKRTIDVMLSPSEQTIEVIASFIKRQNS